MHKDSLADFIDFLTTKKNTNTHESLENFTEKDTLKIDEEKIPNTLGLEETISQEVIKTNEDTLLKKQTLAKSLYNYWVSPERAQEINPENLPVNSWGFYTAIEDNDLTAEEQNYWKNYSQEERDEINRTGSIGIPSLLLTAANPLQGYDQKASTMKHGAGYYKELAQHAHRDLKPMKYTDDELQAIVDDQAKLTAALENFDIAMHNTNPQEEIYKPIALLLHDAAKEYEKNAANAKNTDVSD